MSQKERHPVFPSNGYVKLIPLKKWKKKLLGLVMKCISVKCDAIFLIISYRRKILVFEGE